MLPLGLLSEGEAAMVMQEETNIRSNRADILCRIEEMGFRAGKTVEMLSNEGRGPLLIRVDNARVAIARSLAMKVMVRRAS
jgi:ferrous iron transport protein A